MSKLIPVRYGRGKGMSYPEGIEAEMREVAAHFDSSVKEVDSRYSLHTEYSYLRRSMESRALEDLENIKSARKSGIPQLWYDERWVKEFVTYIKNWVGNDRPPEVIEIHPPFEDYCSNISDFLDLYEVFEERISELYPDANIVLENRSGTQYRSAEFLISNAREIRNLSESVESRELDLQLAVDFPQVFTAHGMGVGDFTAESIKNIFETLMPAKENILSIHIWGKKEGSRAHHGTLDTYFVDKGLKKTFLKELLDLFNDDIPRYFVPEVQSGYDDYHAIINDFVQTGFKFV